MYSASTGAIRVVNVRRNDVVIVCCYTLAIRVSNVAPLRVRETVESLESVIDEDELFLRLRFGVGDDFGSDVEHVAFGEFVEVGRVVDGFDFDRYRRRTLSAMMQEC